MKQLDIEQRVIAPQCLGFVEADIAIALIVQLPQGFGYRVLAFLVRAFCQCLGPFADPLEQSLISLFLGQSRRGTK
jgi:hypothetical protein